MTKFAEGFYITWYIIIMVSIKMVKVKRVLETNPTITGNRTLESKLPIMILTVVLLVNIYTRNSFSLFTSISATRALGFEGPILPFTDSHFITATIIYTIRKFMPFGKELYFLLM
jgi:heme/copper-type cytochrome/quinol oxidase subunit 2